MMRRVALQRPVATALALRAVDVFVLRSDQVFGEQFLTKIAGIALVALYLRLTARR